MWNIRLTSAPITGLRVLPMSTVTLVFTALASITCVAVTVWRRRVFPKVVPGELGLPWWGSTKQFLYECSDFFVLNHKKHGEIFKAVIFGEKYLCVSGKNLVTQVFAQLQSEDLGHGIVSSVRAMVGTDSVIASNGPKHQFLKRILTRVLGPIPVQEYLVHLAPVLVRRIQEWESPADKPEYMNLYAAIKLATLEANFSMFIGHNVLTPEEFVTFHHDLEIIINSLQTIPIDMPGTPYRKGLQVRERLRALIEKLIRERDKNDNKTAIAKFVDAKDDATHKVVDDKTIQDNVISLLIASQETTLASIVSVLKMLAENPDFVRQIRQEWGHENDAPHPDIFLKVTAQEVMSKPFTRAIFYEALRIRPPVSFTVRRVHKAFDLTLSNGHVITAHPGFVIAVSLAATMELTEDTPQPTEIDPTRFIGDRGKSEMFGKGKCGFVPFGGGSRLCPGRHHAELVNVFMVSLIAVCYDLKLSAEHPIEFHDTFGPRPKGDQVILAVMRRGC